ncbi:MAG: hydrolase TatD [Myxococcaceae bacterium]|nr:hydrolase TatD [Myxococcaceae bacterium]
MFDLRLHPDTLSDADLVTLQTFGVRAVLAAPHATEGPTPPKELLAAFEHLVEVQLPRLERAGLRAFAMLGVPGPALPRRGLSEVLQALPALLRAGTVRAIGPLGLGSSASPAHADALLEQLTLARSLRLPAVVLTPARARERVTRQTLALLKRSRLPPATVAVEGATGVTLPLILGQGHHACLCLHPDALRAEKVPALVARAGPERLLLSSAAGAGAADLVAIPRALHLLGKAGLSRPVLAAVGQRTAERFLGL